MKPPTTTKHLAKWVGTSRYNLLTKTSKWRWHKLWQSPDCRLLYIIVWFPTFDQLPMTRVDVITQISGNRSSPDDNGWISSLCLMYVCDDPQRDCSGMSQERDQMQVVVDPISNNMLFKWKIKSQEKKLVDLLVIYSHVYISDDEVKKLSQSYTNAIELFCNLSKTSLSLSLSLKECQGGKYIYISINSMCVYSFTCSTEVQTYKSEGRKETFSLGPLRVALDFRLIRRSIRVHNF